MLVGDFSHGKKQIAVARRALARPRLVRADRRHLECFFFQLIDFDEEKLEMTISGACGAVGYLQDADGSRQMAYQETIFTAR